VYHLDGAGRVDSAEWLEAADDESAVADALKSPMKAVSAELWQRNRRLVCFNQNGIISDDGD
jgi:hypothetical protein